MPVMLRPRLSLAQRCRGPPLAPETRGPGARLFVDSQPVLRAPDTNLWGLEQVSILRQDITGCDHLDLSPSLLFTSSTLDVSRDLLVAANKSQKSE